MINLLNKLLEPKMNGPEIAHLFATLLKVDISNTTLAIEIENHPDYPSLLSISDVLKQIGIDNIGLRIDTKRFSEMPVPLIAQIKGKQTGDDFFTVVREVKETRVDFFDPESHKWKAIPKDLFLERSSGVVLLAEVSAGAGEKDYKIKVKQERQKKTGAFLAAFAIPALVVLSGVIALAQDRNVIFPFLFALLAVCGSIIGGLLLLYELDQHNPILQQICSSGKKVNCSSVLQSKASKVMGLSWSVIGFTYFTGMLLLLLSEEMTSPRVLFVLAWLNTATLPYILFSVYYQWRIAKNWCILCLCVLFTLGMQFLVVATQNWYGSISPDMLNLTLAMKILVCFAFPLLAVKLIMPALEGAKEGKYFRTELQRLKNDKLVLGALLKKQKQVIADPRGLGITIGNPEAPYKIIKVCNPYCGPCGRAHKVIEEFVEHNPNLQVQIIFTATTSDLDHKKPPVKHLLAIAQRKDPAMTRKALDDWYLAPEKDYGAFAARYPMNGELQQQEARIAGMFAWCRAMKIESTPTFFISSAGEDSAFSRFHQLPPAYSIADLRYFYNA
jgi:uncharacterized membrane protein